MVVLLLLLLHSVDRSSAEVAEEAYQFRHVSVTRSVSRPVSDTPAMREARSRSVQLQGFRV